MLKWIAQYDKETGEEIARYKNVHVAWKETGISPHGINCVIEGRFKQVKGYIFRAEHVDKGPYLRKRILTIEEYLFVNDMTMVKLAEMLEVSGATLGSYNSGRIKVSKRVREKLDALCVIFDFETPNVTNKKVQDLDNVFSNSSEMKKVIDSLLLRKEAGRIFVGNRDEGYRVSEYLQKIKVASYVGCKEATGVFVKYDKKIKV